MPVSQQKQLDFITFIQRLLVEGDFVATYKYALLHAIADICIEQPLRDDPNYELVIPFTEIVEKFVILYWQHAVPFSADAQVDESDLLIKQNTGKQAKIISSLFECQNNNIKNTNQLVKSEYWSGIKRDTLKTLKEGPLWRLQKLAKQDNCFLYPHDKTVQHITLKPSIAFCFRRFYDLVVHLARSAWVNKIQSITANQNILGNQTQLHDFLFGVKRQTITKAKPILLEIQKDACFYCQKPLNSNRKSSDNKASKVEIDHFIPFTKYANDLGHNFVAAHSTCNNAKRDHLAAIEHKDRWFEQNIVQHSNTLNDELSQYFNCDAQRSESVTSWAYQIAANNGARLWLGGKEFMDCIR
ncbi:endonuclease [Pseudoalteromonas sp. NBT06-2]|uniref:HNH endonuclease domain-containing protein n=1 Tax=Pseudoalteromonas sp. NBT06-2 TaxID=2025950 RepID=UPI000BA672C4|nr:HNH endonuclease domain-containing protein [Pseudoalteromonas sp. NBT06-2]PAJ73345.1 endonuclease [Pseudoalteromonas sp. NBT06-2]